MTLKNRLDSFIEKGFTYNEFTGVVLSHTGYEQTSLTGRKRNYITLSLYDKNTKKRIQVKAHQFAWYFKYKEVPDYIDHINRITTDNRICNLRNVTNQQNLFNTDSKNYSWHKRYNKYQVSIGLNGKKIHIGYYDSEEDAIRAANLAKKKYHNINDDN